MAAGSSARLGVALRVFALHELRAPIAQVFAFDEARSALALYAKGASLGKVIQTASGWDFLARKRACAQRHGGVSSRGSFSGAWSRHPHRQKQAFTQIRGAGSDGVHPHIVFAPVQSLFELHSWWQVH